MEPTTCSECHGERLAPAPRAVTLGKRRLPEALALSVSDAHAWLTALELPAAARTAIAPVLAELRSRVGLLVEVGLGYLTLERALGTLSGGEARRVRLASSLG